MTESVRERVEEALVAHQRQGANVCLCGWGKLGASFPAHQAGVLAAAGLLAGEES